MNHLQLTINQDFEKARRQGEGGWIARLLRRESCALYDYNEVSKRLPRAGQHDAGLQVVPIRAIVGRAEEFDCEFHPLQKTTKFRWKEIAQVMHQGKALPPVELLKVGRFYFVVDGNHRISVMRQAGQEFVDAHVIERIIPVDVRITTELHQILTGGNNEPQ